MTDIEAAEKALQEARSALQQEDYEKAITVLSGDAAALQKALAALDDAVAPSGSRRRR